MIDNLKSCDHFPRNNFPVKGLMVGSAVTKAPQNSWPWIVQIKLTKSTNTTIRCAGTIIAEDLILTGRLFDIVNYINNLFSCKLLRERDGFCFKKFSYYMGNLW